MTPEEIDREAQDRLMDGLLRTVFDRNAHAHAEKALAGLRRKSRGHLRRAVAALLLMGLGAGLLLVLEPRLPEARAVLDRAAECAQDNVDRQYQVRIVPLGAPEDRPVISATLYVRGSERLAAQYHSPLGSGWFGVSGETSWWRPEGSPGSQWPTPESSRWRERERMAYVQLQTFVRDLSDRFDFATVRSGSQETLIRATRKLNQIGCSTSIVELSVDPRSGIIRKLEARIDPELWHWEPWLVRIELSGTEPRLDAFYTLSGRLDSPGGAADGGGLH